MMRQLFLRRSLFAMLVVTCSVTYGQTQSGPIQILVESPDINNDESDPHHYLFKFWMGSVDSDRCAVFTDLPARIPKNGNNPRNGYMWYLHIENLLTDYTNRNVRRSASDALKVVVDPPHAHELGRCGKLNFLLQLETANFEKRHNVYVFPRRDTWYYEYEESNGDFGIKVRRNKWQDDEPILYFATVKQLYEVLNPVGLFPADPKESAGWFNKKRTEIRFYHEEIYDEQAKSPYEITKSCPLLVKGDKQQDHLLAYKVDDNKPVRFLWLPAEPKPLAFQSTKLIKTATIEQERFDALVQQAFVPDSDQKSNQESERFKTPTETLFNTTTKWASMTSVQLGIDTRQKFNWCPKNSFQQMFFSSQVDRPKKIPYSPADQAMLLAVPGADELVFAKVEDTGGLKWFPECKKVDAPIPTLRDGWLFPPVINGECAVGRGFVFRLLPKTDKENLAYAQSEELTVESFLRSQGLPDNATLEEVESQILPAENPEGNKLDAASSPPSNSSKRVNSEGNIAWSSFSEQWKSAEALKTKNSWKPREMMYAASLLVPMAPAPNSRYMPDQVFASSALNSWRHYHSSRMSNINDNLFFEPVVFVAPAGTRVLLKEELAGDTKKPAVAQIGDSILNTAKRLLAFNYSGTTQRTDVYLRLPTLDEARGFVKDEVYQPALNDKPPTDQTPNQVVSSPLVSEWAFVHGENANAATYYVVGLNRWSDIPCLQDELRQGIEIKTVNGAPPQFYSPVISMRWVIEIDPNDSTPSSPQPPSDPATKEPQGQEDATNECEPAFSGSSAAANSLVSPSADSGVAGNASSEDIGALEKELDKYLDLIFGEGMKDSQGKWEVPDSSTIKQSLKDTYGGHVYWKLQYLRYLVFSDFSGPKKADGQSNSIFRQDELTDSEILKELRAHFP